jgi:endo-1,4-beta-xylanase
MRTLVRAAVAADKSGDSRYATILEREFTMVTPENETNNQRMCGHTLVRHSQLPSWIGSVGDADILRRVVNNHANQLMDHWRGQMTRWRKPTHPADRVKAGPVPATGRA